MDKFLCLKTQMVRGSSNVLAFLLKICAFTIFVDCSLDDLNKMQTYMFIITILFMMLLVISKYFTNSFTPSD